MDSNDSTVRAAQAGTAGHYMATVLKNQENRRLDSKMKEEDSKMKVEHLSNEIDQNRNSNSQNFIFESRESFD